MQTLTYDFRRLVLLRDFWNPVTCSGWVEVHYDRIEWNPGDMGIHLHLEGEPHETRVFSLAAGLNRSEMRRLHRLQQALLRDADLCMEIDEQIGEELTSRRELASEARWREAREATL